MQDQAPHLDLLLDLETRHEDLLVQLDVLDKKVTEVLQQYVPTRQPVAEG